MTICCTKKEWTYIQMALMDKFHNISTTYSWPNFFSNIYEDENEIFEINGIFTD
jgi:hypothetical protein